MTEYDMSGDEVASLMAKPYKLNKAEQKLLAYQMDNSSNIDTAKMCEDLDLTPKSLLKLKISLDRKLGLNEHAGIEERLRKERAKDVRYG